MRNTYLNWKNVKEKHPRLNTVTTTILVQTFHEYALLKCYNSCKLLLLICYAAEEMNARL